MIYWCEVRVIFSGPNLTEIEKRNKYLVIAGSKNKDFLLVIDSDEYAVMDNNSFPKYSTKINLDCVLDILHFRLLVGRSAFNE